MKKRICSLLAAVLMLAAVCLPALGYTTTDGSITVYVTNTGDKYHTSECGYLRSRNELTLQEAVDRGYTPCSRCNPPELEYVESSAQEEPVDTSGYTDEELYDYLDSLGIDWKTETQSSGTSVEKRREVAQQQLEEAQERTRAKAETEANAAAEEAVEVSGAAIQSEGRSQVTESEDLAKQLQDTNESKSFWMWTSAAIATIAIFLFMSNHRKNAYLDQKENAYRSSQRELTSIENELCQERQKLQKAEADAAKSRQEAEAAIMQAKEILNDIQVLDVETVYITKTGRCYHRGWCSTLKGRAMPIPKATAEMIGYKPCPRCKPDQQQDDYQRQTSLDLPESTSK